MISPTNKWSDRDCQSKPSDLLCCLIGNHIRNWDSILSMAKFAYHNSINRTTGMSPFEIVTGYNARTPIDLISLYL